MRVERRKKGRAWGSACLLAGILLAGGVQVGIAETAADVMMQQRAGEQRVLSSPRSSEENEEEDRGGWKRQREIFTMVKEEFKSMSPQERREFMEFTLELWKAYRNLDAPRPPDTGWDR